MKKEYIKWIVIGCAIILFGIFIWQMFYIAEIDKRGDKTYIEKELARIESENKEKQTLLESLQENPYKLEGLQMSTEEKKEYTEKLFQTAEDLKNPKTVNDYMLEFSEEDVLKEESVINTYISTGLIKDAIQEAKAVYDTYNLNTYPEFMDFIKNVLAMEFIVEGDLTTDYSSGLYKINDLAIFTNTFIRSNRNTQANALIFTESEIIPTANIVSIVSIDKCSPRNEMNAGVMMSSLKGYAGHKVIADIDGKEYAFYILRDVETGQLDMYKILFATDSSTSSSTNSYKIYLETNDPDADIITYGTKVKG